MVVDRSTLFADSYFQGFSPADVANYNEIIQDNFTWEKRGLAEQNSDLKQPIAYCIIVNEKTNEIFAYQRASKDGQYDEKRLRGMWSWGIGGHIDKIDLNGTDPIKTSMLREIEEELYMDKFKEPEILGYINDDQTEVGQVHFGLLYLFKTTSKVRPKDSEIAWGNFVPYDKLEEIIMDSETKVETWSEIALEPIRKALGISDKND